MLQTIRPSVYVGIIAGQFIRKTCGLDTDNHQITDAGIKIHSTTDR